MCSQLPFSLPLNLRLVYLFLQLPQPFFICLLHVTRYVQSWALVPVSSIENVDEDTACDSRKIISRVDCLRLMGMFPHWMTAESLGVEHETISNSAATLLGKKSGYFNCGSPQSTPFQ